MQHTTVLKQKGATLIVALVLLAVVTVLGVAGMRTTNLEMKMIASARDQAMAFEAVEAALIAAEKTLEGDALRLKAQLLNDYKNLTACTNGKCFDGVYNPELPLNQCVVGTERPWLNTTNWPTGNVNKVDVQLEAGKVISAHYIIEFRCFTLKEPAKVSFEDDTQDGVASELYMPLFRITARAEGLGQRAQVAAQSTIRINIDPNS